MFPFLLFLCVLRFFRFLGLKSFVHTKCLHLQKKGNKMLFGTYDGGIWNAQCRILVFLVYFILHAMDMDTSDNKKAMKVSLGTQDDGGVWNAKHKISAFFVYCILCSPSKHLCIKNSNENIVGYQ